MVAAAPHGKAPDRPSIMVGGRWIPVVERHRGVRPRVMKITLWIVGIARDFMM
jgi:hypothetical protein